MSRLPTNPCASTAAKAANDWAEAKYERDKKLRQIEMEFQAVDLQIQAEYESLLFYHTVNGVAEAFKDPSFVAHMVLDVVGMVPVSGEPADAVNAVKNSARREPHRRPWRVRTPGKIGSLAPQA